MTTQKTPKSLIEESKKFRLGNRKIFIALIAILLLGGASWLLLSKQSANGKVVTEIEEKYTASKGSLKIITESDGRIINPNIVDLSFLVNGTIDKIYVTEGQKIKKGDVVAELDKREMEFDLRTAKTDVSIAYANLKTKQAELTETDLTLSQNSLEMTENDYKILEKEQKQSVDRTFDLAVIEAESVMPEIEIALQRVDNIFKIDNKNSPSVLVSAFNDSIRESRVTNSYREIRREWDKFVVEYDLLRKPLSQEETFQGIKKITIFAKDVNALLNDLIILIKGAAPTSQVSMSEIESFRSEVYSQNSKISQEINSLTTTKLNLELALSDQANKLEAAQDSVEQAELKYSTTEASTEKLRINKEASLSIQYSQIAQSQLKVDKAEYNLELTTLKAPLDGEVIEINGNEGESIKTESTSSDTAFIKILSDANYTTEVYVEEVDIAKIKLEQKVEITLDAIENVSLEGAVTFISSTATIDNNGIVTYLVRISILDDKDVPLREGMTTYVSFIEGEVNDVILIPVGAVTRSSVTMTDGTRRKIETGLSDGEMIEVTSGLEAGEVILVSDGQPKIVGQGGMGAQDPAGRLARLEAMLKEQGKLPENWATLSDEEKTAKAREIFQAENGAQGGGMGGGGYRPH